MLFLACMLLITLYLLVVHKCPSEALNATIKFVLMLVLLVMLKDTESLGWAD